jgi:hypothetical protein
MNRPRPVALTGAERRALRVIEEALTEEDPGLSVMLGELAEADRPERRVRRTTWIYVAVSVVVLVFGLVVDDLTTVGAGIIMLLFIPVVVLCTAVVVRRWP